MPLERTLAKKSGRKKKMLLEAEGLAQLAADTIAGCGLAHLPLWDGKEDLEVWHDGRLLLGGASRARGFMVGSMGGSGRGGIIDKLDGKAIEGQATRKKPVYIRDIGQAQIFWKAKRCMLHGAGWEGAFYLPFFSSETVSFLRPCALRRATTLAPATVAMRLRKPCLFVRLRREGWYVRFIARFYQLLIGVQR